MSRSHWYVAVALGLALSGFSGALWAQPPELQGVPEQSPAVERENQRKAKSDKEYSDDFPFPVRVIERPDDAKHAREREQKSDDHEAADLQAQRDAARAAERAAKAGEGQESAAWEEYSEPFRTKAEALDWESDGAYSEWLASKADENYRQEMIDAGRGHLLPREE